MVASVSDNNPVAAEVRRLQQRDVDEYAQIISSAPTTPPSAIRGSFRS